MTVKRTVSWTGKTNATLRSREHLTEVKTLLKAAWQNRHGHRDPTLILMAHRHGLRAAELTNPRGDQVDFDLGTLHVRRLKKGISPPRIPWPR